jgi:Raf kinase inhibitor-like YbhB/YbcL family protein
VYGRVLLAAGVLAAASGCSDEGGGAEPPTPSADDVITVTSSAFDDGQPIPSEYSCDGAETSPPLAWTGVPSDAAALALVVDDPDAPGGSYVHWVVVDIDPEQSSVDAGQPPTSGQEVENSSGDPSYAGPCPPSGTHHYRFTVYAMSEALDAETDADLGDLFAQIGDLSLGEGTLVGTYTRQ